MEIGHINKLLALYQAGQDMTTIIVRPASSPRPGQEGYKGTDDAEAFFASLTIIPGMPPRCEVFTGGELTHTGKEALLFLASAGRLRFELLPTNGQITGPKAGNGHQEQLPLSNREPPKQTPSRPLFPTRPEPFEDAPPSRTKWGMAYQSSLPREARKLFGLIDGQRTPTGLARLLYPHRGAEGLEVVLGLLGKLGVKGFILWRKN